MEGTKSLSWTTQSTAYAARMLPTHLVLIEPNLHVGYKNWLRVGEAMGFDQALVRRIGYIGRQVRVLFNLEFYNLR